MTVPENHWEGSGGEFTLLWGGRPWKLNFDEAEPGLRCCGDASTSRLLSLYGLAAAGRSDALVFSPATLVDVERYRSRVQATFGPPGWGGLTVRAAWSPSCGGAGVDLEIQAMATSVGELRAVEVFVQSQWRKAGASAPELAYTSRVQPRDARSAALSFDGRETASELRSLSTLPVTEPPIPRAFSPPGFESGPGYLEMFQPNDVARQIKRQAFMPPGPTLHALALRYGLFGHDVEKGVVFRARLRGCWLKPDDVATTTGEHYDEFLNEPLPLGP